MQQTSTLDTDTPVSPFKTLSVRDLFWPLFLAAYFIAASGYPTRSHRQPSYSTTRAPLEKLEFSPLHLLLLPFSIVYLSARVAWELFRFCVLTYIEIYGVLVHVL